MTAVATIAGRESGLEPLFDLPTGDGPTRAAVLPAVLRARYGGDLVVPLRAARPTLIANFVTTLDGVVSLGGADGAGGGEISGDFEPDRFLMGLLRAVADAVVIGAGTLRAAPAEAWTPAFVDPAGADGHAALRADLGLRRNPTTVVISGSGAIDLDHPGLADPAVEVVLVTTARGASRLRGPRLPGNVSVKIARGERIDAAELIAILASLDVRLALCEGGPRLFGQLLEARLVDELFLTIAPHLAGRSSGVDRLGLVEDTAFAAAASPWARLVGLRRAGSHLFARYRFQDAVEVEDA